VGGIEDHGGELLHDLKAAHIHHKVAVAEAGAALAERYLVVTGGAGLLEHVLHFPRGEELALLDVHGLHGRGRRENEVGLAAEESRSLKIVHHFRHGSGLLSGMDIREHGNVPALANFREDGETFVQTYTAKAGAGRAVGLVEAGLVEEEDAGVRENFLERGGNLQRVGAAFHGAGACDEEKRSGIVGLDIGLAVKVESEHDCSSVGSFDVEDQYTSLTCTISFCVKFTKKFVRRVFDKMIEKDS